MNPMDSPLDQRPTTILTSDPLAPRGPWSFWREALGGGFTGWGLQLILGWVCFQLLTGLAWAQHLRDLAGNSILPAYWGEGLTAKDVLELAFNGGLKEHPIGTLPVFLGGACFLWILWAGWRLQAQCIGSSGRLRTWSWGFVDALLLGLPPLALLLGAASWILENLAETGIQGLCWLNMVGSALAKLAFFSALFLQWWLCRLDREAQPDASWRMGSWKILGRHLGQGLLRLWTHPIQWTLLVLGGVILRTGLALLALAIAWRLGGGTGARVWLFLLLQTLGAALNAWLLGWFLRLTALFWRHDQRVREEIQALERSTESELEPEDA